MQEKPWDITIIGGGAAGLATAIFSAEKALEKGVDTRILILDGARKLGAKILISGGGRCNVTHNQVDETDYNGSVNIIRRTLKSFNHIQAAQWFEALGVSLKTETTGKLFPTSDSARSVLTALLERCKALGIKILTSSRVENLRPAGNHFVLDVANNQFRSKKVVLATGGKALPKSGSDGKGFEFAIEAGHSLVHPLPALVPLVLQDNFFHSDLSGLSHPAELSVWVENKRVEKRMGSMLWTHFGISGPVAMDISGTWIRSHYHGKNPQLQVNLLGEITFQQAETWFLDATRAHHAKSVGNMLGEKLPKPLVRVLGNFLHLDIGQTLGTLTKQTRRQWLRALVELPLPVYQHRGWNSAEVTSGGIPLKEIKPRTFESKFQPGLFLVGEILDCDGRIGGFNFQWAWSTGYLAANGLVEACEH